MDKFKVTHTQTKQNAIMRERERESHINEIYCFACIQLTLTEWLERGMHLVRDERAFTKQKKKNREKKFTNNNNSDRNSNCCNTNNDSNSISFDVFSM